MVHLQITHEKKGTWSEPNLHEDMFQPLIFRGVWAERRTQHYYNQEHHYEQHCQHQDHLNVLCTFWPFSWPRLTAQTTFINVMNIHSCSDYRWNTTAAFPRLLPGAWATSIDHISLWPSNSLNRISWAYIMQHPCSPSQMSSNEGFSRLGFLTKNGSDPGGDC